MIQSMEWARILPGNFIKKKKGHHSAQFPVFGYELTPVLGPGVAPPPWFWSNLHGPVRGELGLGDSFAGGSCTTKSLFVRRHGRILTPAYLCCCHAGLRDGTMAANRCPPGAGAIALSWPLSTQSPLDQIVPYQRTRRGNGRPDGKQLDDTPQPSYANSSVASNGPDSFM